MLQLHSQSGNDLVAISFSVIKFYNIGQKNLVQRPYTLLKRQYSPPPHPLVNDFLFKIHENILTLGLKRLNGKRQNKWENYDGLIWNKMFPIVDLRQIPRATHCNSKWLHGWKEKRIVNKLSFFHSFSWFLIVYFINSPENYWHQLQ